MELGQQITVTAEYSLQIASIRIVDTRCNVRGEHRPHILRSVVHSHIGRVERGNAIAHTRNDCVPVGQCDRLNQILMCK